VNRTLRSAVVVSGHPPRAELLDLVLVDTHDYDVVFVDSFANGYSRIKRVAPDLIIVFLEIDDPAGCQLLTMLKMDRRTSAIPIVTCAVGGADGDCQDDTGNIDRDSSRRPVAVPMN
jgi:DNA-binding response OmpR family regulator